MRRKLGGTMRQKLGSVLARGALFKRKGLHMTVLLTGVGVGVWSCAEQREPMAPLNPSAGHSAFISTMGTSHNNAVAAVLTALQGVQGTLTEFQVLSLMRETIADYFEVTITNNQWEEAKSLAEMAGNEQHPTWTDYVSGPAAEFLQDIWDLLQSEGLSTSTVHAELEDIESAAVAALSGTDETKVLDFLSVAAASTEYWENNHEEWDDVLCDLGHCGISVASDPGSGWRILGADVLGALVAGPWGAAAASTVAFLYEFT